MDKEEFAKIENNLYQELKLDDSDLGREVARIPELFTKYLRLLENEKIELIKMQNQFHRLYLSKKNYYTGKGTTKDYQKNPLDNRVLKAEADEYIKADTDVIRVAEIIAEQERQVNILDQTLRNINNRHWLIGKSMDWLKFTNGIV